MTAHISLTFWFLDYIPGQEDTPKIDHMVFRWQKISELLNLEMRKCVYISWSILKNRECLTLSLTLRRTVDEDIFAYKLSKTLESLAALEEDNFLYEGDFLVQFFDD